MLDTIKEMLNSTDNMPFGEFYQQYVMQVQDSCLDREVMHVVSGSENCNSITELVNLVQEELNSYDQ